ncbi:type II secretion system protein [Bacillus sp. 1P10SD]|uniref:type II secretion system protein n=1 Tax=Bacillus sp. 1P10SD TaxID=3132265 RepID=UPI0039A767DA
MLQKLKNKLKDQRGLTLIELLAVIVILGIISAIAVPSILGIIDKSKKDAKVAEAVQIINSAKLYVTTNPNATIIKKADLTQYLDNVKDTNDFVVKVVKSGNKFIYTLGNHDAAGIVPNESSDKIDAVTDVTAEIAGSKTVTEDELQNYTNAK